MPENNISALLSGYSWSSNVLGYFFADSIGDYRYRYPLFVYGFQPVGASHQHAVQAILQGTYRPSSPYEYYMTLSAVEAVANLTFYSTGTSPSDIAIGRTTLLDRSFAYYPDPTWADPRGGDVWFASNITDVPFGSFQYYTVMHELGHAMGLKHGHEEANTGNPAVLSPDRNSIEFSVMTYSTYVGDSDENFGDSTAPQTLMTYDIAALQYLYGANFNTNNADTYYSWDPVSGTTYVNLREAGFSSSFFMTIWDGGGVDTYDFSNSGQEMTIDLTPGGWSQFSNDRLAYLGGNHYARGNVFNALQYQGDPRSLIENAIGGNFNDSITGNSANNNLSGGSGNDTLIGGAGYDILEGNDGDDWMDGGSEGDTFLGGNGWDTVSYLSASVGPVTVDLTTGQNWGDAYEDILVDIESVRGSNFGDFLISRPQGAHLYGERGDDHLFGQTGSDDLFGGEGNDTIYGYDGADHIRGGPGADVLDGGASIYDTLEYNDAVNGVTVDLYNNTASGDIATGDVISNFENVFGGGGNDVLAGTDIANVIHGGNGHDQIYGYAGADYLFGGDGNDTLSAGSSDLGIPDTLVGGAGVDTFLVLGSRDTLIEDLRAGASGESVVLYAAYLQDFNAVMAAATQVGNDVVIDKPNYLHLVLKDVHMWSLVSSNFSFI